jgi:hypothetical protein
MAARPSPATTRSLSPKAKKGRERIGGSPTAAIRNPIAGAAFTSSAAGACSEQVMRSDIKTTVRSHRRGSFRLGRWQQLRAAKCVPSLRTGESGVSCTDLFILF